MHLRSLDRARIRGVARMPSEDGEQQEWHGQSKDSRVPSRERLDDADEEEHRDR